MDFAQMRRFTEMSKQIEALEARVAALEAAANPPAVRTHPVRAELIKAYTERFGEPPHRNTPTMAIERMLSQRMLSQ